MEYVGAQDILVLHARIIAKTGGREGIRDIHLLASLVERPKASFGGKEMFRTVLEKAAVYLESLAKYYVFVDGNKRTALAASARFLFINGYKLTASNTEAENFVLRVAAEKFEIEEIIEWFKKYSKKV
ncbi:type II toxin-antitoxin system death-on-curing family toxin [Patescibacteria group bacterium]|nr:type II toxin-antitoxin system death-on-curing family toxin [Patescibacteria group bacterium]